MQDAKTPHSLKSNRSCLVRLGNATAHPNWHSKHAGFVGLGTEIE